MRESILSLYKMMMYVIYIYIYIYILITRVIPPHLYRMAPPKSLLKAP
jgi:hypothetical protein